MRVSNVTRQMEELAADEPLRAAWLAELAFFHAEHGERI